VREGKNRSARKHTREYTRLQQTAFPVPRFATSRAVACCSSTKRLADRSDAHIHAFTLAPPCKAEVRFGLTRGTTWPLPELLGHAADRR
jgi:hypothetical protein